MQRMNCANISMRHRIKGVWRVHTEIWAALGLPPHGTVSVSVPSRRLLTVDNDFRGTGHCQYEAECNRSEWHTHAATDAPKSNMAPLRVALPV